MTTQTQKTVNRRSALAGIGAGGLGAAAMLGTTSVSAQDATPASMVGHPMVGTWVIVRDVTNTSEVPVVVVISADGAFIDANQRAAGVWEPTGPNSAIWTFVPFIDGGDGGYVVVRSTAEIADDGETLTGTAHVTVLTPDGTVVAQGEQNSTGFRLHAEQADKTGNGIPGFPAWTPAPPVEGTPTS
jgi:hypothetical protein